MAVMKDNKIVFFGTHYDDNKADIYDIASNTCPLAYCRSASMGFLLPSVNNTIYVAGGFINGMYNDKVWKPEF